MGNLPHQLTESFYEMDISGHQEMETHFKDLINGTFTRQF